MSEHLSEQDGDFNEATPQGARLTWTGELQEAFLRIIDDIGPSSVSPKLLSESLNARGFNVSRVQVKGHLQKHRLKLKAGQDHKRKHPNASSRNKRKLEEDEHLQEQGSEEALERDDKRQHVDPDAGENETIPPRRYEADERAAPSLFMRAGSSFDDFSGPSSEMMEQSGLQIHGTALRDWAHLSLMQEQYRNNRLSIEECSALVRKTALELGDSHFSEGMRPANDRRRSLWIQDVPFGFDYRAPLRENMFDRRRERETEDRWFRSQLLGEYLSDRLHPSDLPEGTLPMPGWLPSTYTEEGTDKGHVYTGGQSNSCLDGNDVVHMNHKDSHVSKR